MFDGRAATHASFRAKFLSWAVVQIAGVDELDALRNPKDPSTWYPRQHRVEPDATPLLRYYRDFHREASDIQRRPTVLWCDNESTVKNMHNESGSKTGHLNRRQASSREDVREGRCDARSVPGDDNPADILTKSLPTATHTKHADYILGLTNLRNLLHQD